MHPTSPADGRGPRRPPAPGLHSRTFHLAPVRTSGQAWQDSLLAMARGQLGTNHHCRGEPPRRVRGHRASMGGPR